jgi:hypothetical protein
MFKLVEKYLKPYDPVNIIYYYKPGFEEMI